MHELAQKDYSLRSFAYRHVKIFHACSESFESREFVEMRRK